MHHTLKASLLTGVFASVAFVAGCSHSKPAAAPAAPAGPTPAQMLQTTTAHFDAQGSTVVANSECVDYDRNGSSDPGCDVAIQAKQDDGLQFRGEYWLQRNSFEISDCSWRNNDPFTDAKIDKLSDKFDADARRRFTGMGFTVLGPYNDPAGSLYISASKTCIAPMENTYLLRAKTTNALYTADYHEFYDARTGQFISGDIKGIEAVDHPAAPKRAASPAPAAQTTPPPADDDTPANPASSSSSSKLCIGACIGPHIDLQTGQVKVLGTGPGYKLQ